MVAVKSLPVDGNRAGQGHVKSPKMPSPDIEIRDSDITDLPAMTALEEDVFVSDRLNRRQFRWLLTKGHAVCLTALVEGVFAGYAISLSRRGTALARLYSIAVGKEYQGRGVGSRLMEAITERAVEEGAIALRLEVRAADDGLVAYYRRRGFRQIAFMPGYYGDGADALRMEMTLLRGQPMADCRVPYIPQSTDFTCGPAVMQMVLATFLPGAWTDRGQELELWREATTIYMASGHGGCAPYGIARALTRRGLSCHIRSSQAGPLFLETVRNPEKRDVMAAIQEQDIAACRRLGVRMSRSTLGMEGLKSALDEGCLAICLISSYRMYGDRQPHWVLVHGHDKTRFFVHDPWVDEAEMDAPADKANLPIAFEEFGRMAGFGRNRLKVTVVVSPPVAGGARA